MAKAPKAGAKKAAPKPAGPGAIAAGGGLGGDAADKGKQPEEPESFSATGIDNALDLLEVVTSKTDKASVGQQAAGLERHPEVCACGTMRNIHADITRVNRDASRVPLRHTRSASYRYSKLTYVMIASSPHPRTLIAHLLNSILGCAFDSTKSSSSNSSRSLQIIRTLQSLTSISLS